MNDQGTSPRMNGRVNTIIQGDCLEVLKTLPDNSVDSIVTDPPAGISFMGKSWDGDKGGRDNWIKWLSEVMSEGLRVIKPGGHALVWALPRTSHWTALALEDAGFEVRDCVYHLFGSGFPKSLDIGKAVDKLKGNKREEYIDKDFLRRNPDTGQSGKGIINKGHFDGKKASIRTKGTSEWEGWGTTLKPAVECWWLVRKPLSEKTVAENVLKWRTGGLNIDGSRVESEPELAKNWQRNQSQSAKEGRNSMNGGLDTIDLRKYTPQGRFPSHLIHDGSDEVVREFPNTKSGGGDRNSKGKTELFTGFGDTGVERSFPSSDGSAARFFYCAKPSKSERDRGLEGFELSARPTMGSGIGGQPNQSIENSNNHPTVKAQALMTYLIKLITPSKGIVLDMFAGSGSTLVAAKTLGHPFIGIELEEDYVKIAQARVAGAKIKSPTLFETEAPDTLFEGIK